MKRLLSTLCLSLFIGHVFGAEPVKTDLLSTVPQYVQYESSPDAFCIAAGGKATSVYVSSDDWAGVVRAARDLGRQEIWETTSARCPALRRRWWKVILPRRSLSLWVQSARVR